MSRDKAVKIVLKLITLILERYDCKVTKEGEGWECRFSGTAERFDDQLEAVLHGCGIVIPLQGGKP